jgi:integrase
MLHRFYTLNGVKFDPLELQVIRAVQWEDRDDKPLTLPMLQKMMDVANIRGKALVSFLISTGLRSGEAAQVELSDVDGVVVRIRNKIAKSGRGGTVYLTAEAREYLDLFLDVRDEYLRVANLKTFGWKRPEDYENRLFGISRETMRSIFARLYDTVDGERGRYHARCTIHSCRKYFRTQAVRSMPLDVVEKIMRHTGYLTAAYVRISDDETQQLFHAGEHALYITRSDQRLSQNELDNLKRENKELRERDAEYERRLRLVEKYIGEKGKE